MTGTEKQGRRADIDAVLGFWFDEHEKDDWFKKDDAFDAAIRDRFGVVHDRLTANPDEARAWAESPRGALAVLVVLDQFSRNLYRGDGRAFAADALAREIARDAIARGFHHSADLPDMGWLILFLPFEHSEYLADQDWSCAICRAFDDGEFLQYANAHRDIIVRFGRFPHRNAALGRDSTPEEEAFLTQPGSSF
ncbi:MAG: DUF924 family protein [Alphaproteobacteria bacterium]